MQGCQCCDRDLQRLLHAPTVPTSSITLTTVFIAMLCTKRVPHQVCLLDGLSLDSHVRSMSCSTKLVRSPALSKRGLSLSDRQGPRSSPSDQKVVVPSLRTIQLLLHLVLKTIEAQVTVFDQSLACQHVLPAHAFPSRLFKSQSASVWSSKNPSIVAGQSPLPSS